MRTILVVILASLCFLFTLEPETRADGLSSFPEIHCKHFIYGIPVGTPVTNDLIIRDIYALSSNDSTKFADWVAYRLDVETVVSIA